MCCTNFISICIHSLTNTPQVLKTQSAPLLFVPLSVFIFQLGVLNLSQMYSRKRPWTLRKTLFSASLHCYLSVNQIRGAFMDRQPKSCQILTVRFPLFVSHSVKRRSFKGRKLFHGERIPTLPRRPDALVKEEQLISRKVTSFIFSSINIAILLIYIKYHIESKSGLQKDCFI